MSVTDKIRTGASSKAPGGPGTAVFKYDLLTALGAFACGADKHVQRTTLRFVTLMTARYDWQRDILATGQREIAALWSVNERTVKREVARLRTRGWLVLKYPAARGRVACHGLGIAAILVETQPFWSAVGPDFVARMTGPEPKVAAANVIPFLAVEAGLWGDICARWHRVDPATHLTWIAPLISKGLQDGRLKLRAPSRFHASFVRTHYVGDLLAHARAVSCGIEGVEIVDG
ncbi:MAG: DnaA N-terminal domain-containing protein [Jannaschia sp.]